MGRLQVEAAHVDAGGVELEVDGKPVEAQETLLYYMLNKPTGVITSVNDPAGRKTVLDLMQGVPGRIYPVGRLDYNTSGLLFLTNDGEFAQRVMHPRNRVGKVYLVRIAGQISKEKLSRLRSGVDIGGFVTSRARVDVLQWTKHSTMLEIEIHEGKNRQVRRMFEAVGKHVEELHRLRIGKIGLGHLKEGTYRKLRQEEIDWLMKQ